MNTSNRYTINCDNENYQEDINNKSEDTTMKPSETCDEFECMIERLKSLGLAAVYETQIQYGGPDAEWHDDADLIIVLKNRRDIIPTCKYPATGTTVSWCSENGNGSITFFAEKEFRGSAQFPGEGPVGYRGMLK